MADGQIKFSGKGQPGNLSDPLNWVGGQVPTGVNQIAVITTNVGAPIQGTFSLYDLMLLGPEQITFAGTLNTLSMNQCKDFMVCAGAVATFSPGAVLNDNQDVNVGVGGVGTLVAQGTGNNHSVLNTLRGVLGTLKGVGNGTITIDDGIWNNTENIVVGVHGTGTLNVIDGGSVVTGTDLCLALCDGSSGTMNIASGGSVSMAGILWDGADGQTAPASTGIVHVGVGSSLTTGDMLFVNTGSELDIAGGTVKGGVNTNCVNVRTGGVISGFGTLATPDGAAILDCGVIRATGGTFNILGNLRGTGSLQIAANSTAAVTGSSLGLSSIAFIGSSATLSLAHGAGVASAISGFGLSDMISEANITAVSFAASTGVLKLMQSTTLVETLHFVGSFAGETFGVHQVAGSAIIALQHS